MGDFIEFLYSRFLLSNGVSIDTRTIERGNLFFAISGPNFDANQFVRQALEKGAAYAVVDNRKFATDDRIILAKDSLVALQNLAKFHRSRFKRPMLAITGSNGKTTTKELIAKVLSGKYVVHATKGNYNNHIGVPLTLLHIHPQVEIAIIEMGANHVGEIAQLCELSAPTHGIITNIGHAHTEGFGGFEGVIRGKSELFDYLKKNDEIIFLNMNDRVISNMAMRFQNSICYPQPDVKLISGTPNTLMEVSGVELSTNLIGAYNIENIAAAIAIGRTFEVSDEKICAAISSYEPDNARSQIIKKGSLTIVLDAYNANPDSMTVALESLSTMKQRKIAILGDMNELENSEEAHTEILDLANNLPIDQVLTVGKKIGKTNHKGPHFDHKEDLVVFLEKENFSDSVVLLKASRSIKLETILENIKP